MAAVRTPRSGALYLVATPIGNLEDITLRALRVLREAHLIACEDTRHTRGLLTRYEISGKRLLSCHEHNEEARAEELVEAMQAGQNVALVSDAGTPCISDPGFRVVRAAITADLPVFSIPGPVAAVAALAASGLPPDSFRFHGFPPAKQGQRRTLLTSLRDEGGTQVFYEAPHRIVKTLADILETLGDRRVVVVRELTKVHEEILRGTASSVMESLSARERVKGEIVLLVAPGESPAPESTVPIAERVAALIAEGAGRMDAIKQAARERGISKRDAYSELESDE